MVSGQLIGVVLVGAQGAHPGTLPHCSSLLLQLPPATSAVLWTIRMGKSQSLGLNHCFIQLNFPMDL